MKVFKHTNAWRGLYSDDLSIQYKFTFRGGKSWDKWITPDSRNLLRDSGYSRSCWLELALLDPDIARLHERHAGKGVTSPRM